MLRGLDSTLLTGNRSSFVCISFFFFSSRRRHTRLQGDWSSDVCSSDLQKPRDLTDLYSRSRGEGFGAEVKRRIMTGTYVLSAGYYDAYYLKAQRVRQLINADFTRAFGSVDVLMGPTTPTPAFAVGAKTSDPITMYLNDIYTIGDRKSVV